MPSEDEQNKERSKVSLRIGEVHVELEGTSNNIKKLMDKELFEFTKKLEETTKPLPSSTEVAPQVTPKAPEVTPQVAPKAPQVAPQEISVPPPSKPSTVPEAPAKKSRFFAREKKTEKVSKRKIGWKPMAIALVLVCIVLSAGLIGVIAIYLPMVNDLNSQVAEKDIDIAALSSEFTSLNSQVSSLQATLDQYNRTNSNLREGIEILNLQIESYLNLLYLNASGYLVLEQPFTQNASEYTVIFQNLLDYAGYVGVSAQSTSNTTYVQVLYSSYGVNYDHNVTVTTSGTAYFPVLPGGVEIRVGNTDTYSGDSVNATATAVYYY